MFVEIYYGRYVRANNVLSVTATKEDVNPKGLFVKTIVNGATETDFVPFDTDFATVAEHARQFAMMVERVSK